ncbi:MAG: sigma 54-interacting transcriptional regulator [Proteobacteria bacterium]|nr:sigma 54-interacting transcriptional regulator [Pseudomonadota bacterium]MBU4356061.1 sigma 54-interacting transcriptional regulator [Pseudomonadota bacterium]
MMNTLRKHRLELVPFAANARSFAGILFFDEVTSGVLDFLRQAGQPNSSRIVGIAIKRTNLPVTQIWRLLQAGAADIFVWDRMNSPAEKLAARIERWESIESLINSPLITDNLVGKSSVWLAILRRLVEAAQFTEASVLLEGETGTGKELAARLIHSLDSRPGKGKLIILDCATIVPELSGSEFFGHERGAFTGAVSSRDGAFALANGGTLFLDEVGELPLTLQAQLLRVIQEGTYKRVGGNSWHDTRFRLVCATNQNLMEKVLRGEFRRDLYYRMATITCHLPALQERPEDIVPLARHFIHLLRPEDTPELDEAVQAWLLTREYHGNVRELKQLTTRMLLSYVSPGPITVGDIPEDERPSVEDESEDWCDLRLEHTMRRAIHLGLGLKEIRKVVVETLIRIALSEEEGNIQRAARKLGVTPRALQIRRAGQ